MKRMKARLLLFLLAMVVLIAAGWGGLRVVQLATKQTPVEIPTTRVKKGKVTIVVSARGELQGGNSELLTAPMVGGGEIIITYLRDPGELVQKDDIVAEFDTTQQEFNLREAQADLAEAEQQVKKAEADAEAALEEARYQMLSAAAEVAQADLEIRKNEVLSKVVARQNEIALDAAHNRLAQAERDFNNKKNTGTAGIAIQKASVEKAKVVSAN